MTSPPDLAKGQHEERHRDSSSRGGQVTGLIASELVRFLATGIAGLVLLGVPAVAVGESGEELRVRGEQLARDGRYTEAIDAFKAAEKIEPRARHSCFIALAYTRREAWAQAEVFLDQCHKRASASDPLPEWVPMVDQLLAERLPLAAPIEIKVEPPGTEIKLTVSSFAPDEIIAPRTIHLAPGRHVVIATAQGYNDAQKTVDVSDKSPQTITITMLPVSTLGPDPGGAIVAGPTAPPSRVPTYVMAGGGAIVLAGAIVHATLFRTARNNLDAANELATRDPAAADAQWKEWSPKFDTRRNLTIALYGVGAATVITGLVLKYAVFKSSEQAPQVSFEPSTSGGGWVTVGWVR
ncbi:MAG: hypothetical protein JWP01_4209 [Myxococcales bacterium]|nr:hypothetical protein [Myxococcales bacterium]